MVWNIVISFLGGLIGFIAIVLLLPKMVFRNRNWHEEARRTIQLKAKELERLPSADLCVFVGKDKSEQCHLSNIPVTITIWAKEHFNGQIGVVVEARRSGPLGMSQVITEGFYKDDSGATHAMQEKDFWEHGY